MILRKDRTNQNDSLATLTANDGRERGLTRSSSQCDACSVTMIRFCFSRSNYVIFLDNDNSAMVRRKKNASEEIRLHATGSLYA